MDFKIDWDWVLKLLYSLLGIIRQNLGPGLTQQAEGKVPLLLHLDPLWEQTPSPE